MVHACFDWLVAKRYSDVAETNTARVLCIMKLSKLLLFLNTRLRQPLDVSCRTGCPKTSSVHGRSKSCIVTGHVLMHMQTRSSLQFRLCIVSDHVHMQMVIKCADIGHLAVDPKTHKRWAYQLEEEFFRQVCTRRKPCSPQVC